MPKATRALPQVPGREYGETDLRGMAVSAMARLDPHFPRGGTPVPRRRSDRFHPAAAIFQRTFPANLCYFPIGTRTRLSVILSIFLFTRPDDAEEL